MTEVVEITGEGRFCRRYLWESEDESEIEVRKDVRGMLWEINPWH